MNPVTRQMLDQMHCSSPGCDHGGHELFLHGRCHPGEGNEIEYKDGVLHIRCNTCKKSVVKIKVASEELQ